MRATAASNVNWYAFQSKSICICELTVGTRVTDALHLIAVSVAVVVIQCMGSK